MKLRPSLVGASAAIALALHPAAAFAQADAAPAPNPAEADPGGHGDPGDPGFASALSVTEETFSLTIADADHLLHDVPSDALRYARLREMLASGKARLERLVVLRTKSGQRAVAESIDELRYASEFRPPQKPDQPAAADKGDKPAPKTPPAAPAAETAIVPVTFETRNVGDTLELEPVLGPDGVTIDLNLVPQSVRYVGDHADGGPHPVKTPLFETSKITTSVTVRDGEPYFLGTLNPPFANGLAREQKEQRVWLDFFTVDVIRLGEGGVSKGKAATLAKAKALRLAKLEFHEATVTEAVEFLRRKSVELDPEKKGVNIVLKVPPDRGKAKVTLSLADVPLLDALRYLANLAALVVEPEDSALLLRAAGENP